MFIDASVIVAILAREPGFEEIEKRIDDWGGPFTISPLSRFEAVTALARMKNAQMSNAKPSPALFAQAKLAVNAFVEALSADELAIDARIGDMALAASMTFGKAVGHPADLNFGDCFAYACAKTLGRPLLYKGNDFALTDLG